MHSVAMVDGAQGLAKKVRQDPVEMLSVAPGSKGRVLAQGALGDFLLRSNGSLRVDDGEGGEPDTREQDGERDAKAKRRWKLRGHRTMMSAEPVSDNGRGV